MTTAATAGSAAAESAATLKPTTIDPAVWTAIRPFVVSAIEQADLENIATVRVYMRHTAAFVAWLSTQHVPLTLSTAFTHDMVESYLSLPDSDPNTGLIRTKASRADAAGRLRRVGRAANPAGFPAPSTRASAARGLRAPYTRTEVAAINAAVKNTAVLGELSDLANTVTHLCFGAGLKINEVRAACGSWIVTAGGVVIVKIPALDGYPARTVPVAAPYTAWLLARAAQVGNGHLHGMKVTPRTFNTFGEKCATIRPRLGVNSFAPQRMRTTWMLRRVQLGASPTTVTEHAGLKTLEWYSSLAPQLPPQSAEQVLIAMVSA